MESKSESTDKRRSERERPKIVYTSEEAIDEYKWTKLLKSKTFSDDDFPRMNGFDITKEWAADKGMEQPVLIEKNEELGMNMPTELTVDQVANLCGRQRIVDVIQVSTQTDIQMTLDEWAAYYNQEKRDRILNVISLEIGKTALGKMVKRPFFVRQLDWIDHVWPQELKMKEYPQVQLYCLMGVHDSYTDFHIDFGGTSVFYHIIAGEKIFYFIEPTPKNLKIYEKWSSSPDQSRIFLGDLVSVCKKVHLYPGNTMIIPSGWIHAVFTPRDAIVIGGNFLHGLGITMQLKIHEIEVSTHVPFRFRFPYFIRMQWYAAKYYLYQLKENRNFTNKELISIESLLGFLTNLAKESTNMLLSKEERKTIRSDIPEGLKNVKLLLKNLKLILQAVKNGSDSEIDDDDEWASDITEMEFLDSEDELDAFRPQDEILESDDVASGSDAKDFDDDSGQEEYEMKRKKSTSTVSKKTVPKISLKLAKPELNLMANVKNEAILNAPVSSVIVPAKKSIKPKNGVFSRLSKKLNKRR